MPQQKDTTDSFVIPKTSATPEEKKKFVILSILGSIVIFLILILTFTFSGNNDENTDAQFFTVIGKGLQESESVVGGLEKAVSPLTNSEKSENQ